VTEGQTAEAEVTRISRLAGGDGDAAVKAKATQVTEGHTAEEVRRACLAAAEEAARLKGEEEAAAKAAAEEGARLNAEEEARAKALAEEAARLKEEAAAKAAAEEEA